MITKNELLNRIIEKVEEKKIKTIEIIEGVDLNPSTVYRYLNKVVEDPDRRILLKMADFVGVDGSDVENEGVGSLKTCKNCGKSYYILRANQYFKIYCSPECERQGTRLERLSSEKDRNKEIKKIRNKGLEGMVAICNERNISYGHLMTEMYAKYGKYV